jgi:hypothetical protein
MVSDSPTRLFFLSLTCAVVKLLDRIAVKFGLPPIPWDSVDIGCFPSGSAIPSKDQRSLSAGYEEIATWLDKNPSEFVMLYHG